MPALRVGVLLILVLTLAWSLLAILVTGPVTVNVPRSRLGAGTISAERLRADVEKLSVELAPLDYRRPERLARAADWIAGELAGAGFDVEFQEYRLREGDFRNVVARRAGTEPGQGATVIGAHYDTYGGFPGANDNASGVAVLLELARTLPDVPLRGDLYLVAFCTEEPPFFGTDDMGSAAFVRALQTEGVEVGLMIALDVVGYYSDAPGSQGFPLPLLGWLYPDRGNFVAVVGDLGSGAAIKRVKQGLRASGDLAVHSFRAPASVAGVDWSDHLSFRRQGLPAVLVTDTAFMRYPYYHTRQDTAEKLDYPRMALLVRALHDLAGFPLETPPRP